MAEAPSGPGGPAGVTPGVEPRARDASIDWIAAERSPEFRELIAKRRSFVLPATIFFFLWYFGFIALCGYAPGFMGTPISGGFTVGYLLALTQFVMVWALGGLYLWRSDRDFDPLARRAADVAVAAGARPPAARESGRPPR